MRAFVIAALAVLSVLAPRPASAQLGEKPVLTLEAVRQAVAAAESVARGNGWNVVIVVVGDGGHLVYLQRMDDVQLASIEVAQAGAEAIAALGGGTRSGGR